MAFVATTLVVASALHLAGRVHGSDPFDPDRAGVAEAVIAAVLAGGAVVLFRKPERGRGVGLAALGFAIVGFVVGLNFTTRGGHAPDIAYHVIVLPALIGAFVVHFRAERHSRSDNQ